MDKSTAWYKFKTPMSGEFKLRIVSELALIE
jgi:hypothetical protein